MAEKIEAKPLAAQIQYYKYFPQAASLFWLRKNFTNSIESTYISSKRFMPLGHDYNQTQVNIRLPSHVNSQVFEQGVGESMRDDLFLWQYHLLAAYNAILLFVVKLNPFPSMNYIFKAKKVAYSYSPSFIYKTLFVKLGTDVYQENYRTRLSVLEYLSYGFGFSIQFGS